MNNLEVVKNNLLKKFPPSRVEQFLQWVNQTQPDLVKIIENDPQRAAVKLSEILTIVLSA